MALRPLHDTILFVFVDDGAGGRFLPKSRSGILLTNQSLDYNNSPKWGKVLAVGREVKDVQTGDYILIESLQWTPGFTHDDVKIWKTVENKVIATTNDIELTYQY